MGYMDQQRTGMRFRIPAAGSIIPIGQNAYLAFDVLCTVPFAHIALRHMQIDLQYRPRLPRSDGQHRSRPEKGRLGERDSPLCQFIHIAKQRQTTGRDKGK